MNVLSLLSERRAMLRRERTHLPSHAPDLGEQTKVISIETGSRWFWDDSSVNKTLARQALGLEFGSLAPKKKLGMVTCICSPSFGEAETDSTPGAHQLTQQVRDPVSKHDIRSDRERYLTLTSYLLKHIHVHLQVQVRILTSPCKHTTCT